jgi:hypothetical protein
MVAAVNIALAASMDLFIGVYPWSPKSEFDVAVEGEIQAVTIMHFH